MAGEELNGAGEAQTEASSSSGPGDSTPSRGEPSAGPELIVIHIVTYNHQATIARCLRSAVDCAAELERSGLRALVRLSDNGSRDQTVATARSEFQALVEITVNPVNLGFSGGHNLGFARAIEEGAEYVLVLNPDLRLEPRAVNLLVRALKLDRSAGSACPKLLRADANLEPVTPPRFDSTGMYMTPALRHFDRGSNEPDTGQYNRPEYVFGATGACVLFRRDFLLDQAISFRRDEGKLTRLEVFDEDYFAYREDADLAWRAQRCAWRCRYVAESIGYHVRSVLPENRTEIAEKINSWSVRNRFLMQWSNLSLASNLHCLIAGTWRNLLVIGGVLTYEHESLTGLWQSIKLIPKSLDKRRIVFRRRRVREARIGRWFSSLPYAEPALVRKQLPDEAAIEDVRNGEEQLDNFPISPIRSVTAVIVNYNAGPRLERALQALVPAVRLLAPRIDFKVVVLDNGSTDDSMELCSRFEQEPGFQFVRAGKNLGFGGGVNLGFKTCAADSVLILNPDVEIEPTEIAILAGALDRYPTLAAVAPLLYPEKDSGPEFVQRHYAARSFPTAGSILAELFYLHRLWPTNPWTSAQFLERDEAVERGLGGIGSEPTVVEQPAAACLLVRGSVYLQVNGFDEQFYPAWFEDVDLLKRVWQAGYVSAFHPQARAVHAGGYSKDGLRPSLFASIWYTNLARYIDKHFFGGEKVSLQMLLRVALVLRAAVELGRSFVSTGESGRRLAGVLINLALSGFRR